MIEPERKFKNNFVGESARWKRRFEVDNTPAPVHQTLYETIEQFDVFVTDYLVHFEGDATAKTEPFPWLDERIKSTLLEYWMPLSRIAAQYYLPECKTRLNKTQVKLKNFIDNADALKIELAEILLYINKLPNSYFYPYTTRSFIALSWTDKKIMTRADQINDDMVMALPHEIGHHVYWNNNFGNPGNIFNSRLTLPDEIWNPLRNETPRIPEPELKAVEAVIKSWTEEIFADVLGTLISGDGEIFASSAQSLVDRFCRDSRDLIYNDGKHPILYLRSLISAHTLKPQTLAPSVNWEKFAKSLTGIPETMKVEFREKNQKTLQTDEVKLTSLKRALELAVDYIYNNVIYNNGKLRGLPLSSDRITDFEELKIYARQKYPSSDKDVMNFLLTPLAFERDLAGTFCTKCGYFRYIVCPSCGAS